jgi:serine/threonine protein kinase
MRLGDDRHLGYSHPDAIIGTRVGPLTIVRLLGAGSMSKVYVAEHAVLKTRRAVKFLSSPLTQDGLLVRRFVNEARAVAKLHHRNLIQVHDVGQTPSGAWFMVLDHLEGETLGGYMATHAGPMPAHAIVHVVCEIANGLQVVHDHKLVHRDLKPQNVFLVIRDGDPYHAVVLDFGFAPPGDDLVAGAQPGAVSGAPGWGTPAYMSPEQLRGTPVGPAADIFSLGIITYQLSTGGWFPHQQQGESRAGYCELAAVELYHRQVTRPAIDPRDRCATLSSAWASAILAAINPDPAGRPASVRAFALRLAEAVTTVGPSPLGIANGLALARTSLYERDGGGREAVRSLRPSPEIGSRYRLGDKLGTGGMAEVFTGTMIGVEGFARRVAIKRVRAGLSQVPAFAAMLVAEAQIVSQLAHPNIVSVLDFSRDHGDRLFLVMEYVDGKDLASLLKSGPITASLAIYIVIEMLRGLGYAHDLPDPSSGTRGVVHRDVSPQNLLLSYEGAVKVSDFGLAKAREASEGVWSETVRGKPSYMSPEQVSGDMLDGRTDLYAAGVMLWEMLAHRALFAGTSKEIIAQVMFKGIAAPSDFRAPIPADLEAIAMKLLARDRKGRFPTAEAAIDALLCCRDVPRDGRGELAQLLAARFPRPAAVRWQRTSGAAAEAVSARRPEQVTVPEPSGVAVRDAMPRILRRPAAGRLRRGLLTAMVAALVLASVAVVAVIARGEVAQSRTTDRVVPPSPGGAPAPAVHEAPATWAASGGAPVDAGGADAGSVDGAAPGATGEGAAVVRPGSPPPSPRQLQATRTGELAVLAKPWAVIWLNGKRSGQTPFRAVVPAGRYRVRLANDDIGKDEITTITVEPDETATVERNW